MRLMKLMPAVLIIAPLTTAHAGAWNFQYQGFYDSQMQAFDDTNVLGGWFAGDDLDHNGTIDESELTDFRLDGTDYLACNGPLTCVIPSFSFAASGELDFLVARTYREGSLTAGYSVVTGDKISAYVTEDGYTNYMAEWRWTEATALAISAVPEPAVWMMLISGTLLLSVQRYQARITG